MMDEALSESLEKWHKQIEAVRVSEGLFLQLEASEKSMFGRLFLSAEGKSIAEREAKAACTKDWVDFTLGAAAAKNDYNHQKRLLELSQAAFNAVYLQTKQEGGAIQRMPREIT